MAPRSDRPARPARLIVAALPLFLGGLLGACSSEDTGTLGAAGSGNSPAQGGGSGTSTGAGGAAAGAPGTSAGSSAGGSLSGSGGQVGAGASAGGSAPGGGGAAAGGSGGGATGGSNGTSGSSGAGTGGSGMCSKPSAPNDLQNTIDLTWKEMTGGFEGKTGARPVSAGLQTFKNAVLDQVLESGGKLNFCVRYESNVKVTAAQRDKVQAALQRGVDEWFAKLKGYDCFPYDKITTTITGWATVNRATFDWPDGGVPLFINQIGYENVAQCPDACSRFVRYHNGQLTKDYAYPGCTGGAANHFDMHLWLTEGMGIGGAGGDWGQRLDRAYFMDSVDEVHQHIWLHEFGHGFGFPDYYNWDAWAPGVAEPNSVMVAGLGLLVTEWDGWMLRATYSNLKSRWK